MPRNAFRQPPPPTFTLMRMLWVSWVRRWGDWVHVLRHRHAKHWSLGQVKTLLSVACVEWKPAKCCNPQIYFSTSDLFLMSPFLWNTAQSRIFNDWKPVFVFIKTKILSAVLVKKLFYCYNDQVTFLSTCVSLCVSVSVCVCRTFSFEFKLVL